MFPGSIGARYIGSFAPFAVAEATVPIDRECRMVGYGVVQIEAAKPAVSEMQFDLLAQSPLEADAIAVAHDQHPNHEFRVDRGPTNLAIEWRELLAHVGKQSRQHRIDATQEMACRNAFLEVEQVKQLALVACLPAHHGESPSLNPRATESLFARLHEPFFNSIDPERTFIPKRAKLRGT